ncbi:hypothetical protein EV379_1237 [Microterricola gilva]|uniref:Terminase small subunit n=1 Tax=Microterricola gilva TaxID=393267 RepID=A0A4V2GAM7_9MICO|nr:hypothetical protein [Microterricola gilva]RZU64926.1 hypothetical protein EV379_1237 [Microterricola gilva]
MASGGARSRSGPAPDPDSYRSQNREWIDLPAAGFSGEVPNFPLAGALGVESELWAELWSKPQASAWSALGLKYQVAAYVRAFLESVEPEASAGLKTAVLRMENELGISIAGMKQNLWRVAATPSSTSEAVKKPAARKTPTNNWLEAVRVEGA